VLSESTSTMRRPVTTPILTYYLFIDIKTAMGAQAKNINRDGLLAASGRGQQRLHDRIVDLRPELPNGDVIS
jgi:hypothetical protein